MRTLIVITAFLFVSSTFGYPSKPLNERPTELNWDAWLYIDDQNQTKQENEGGSMKKKVIPKSVFIAPTFTPPSCPDGYTSDSMGRCLKVFQVDKKNQLQFLLNKLQTRLENSRKPSTGPERITIGIPQINESSDGSRYSFISRPDPEGQGISKMVTETTTLSPTTSTINTPTVEPEEVVSTMITSTTFEDASSTPTFDNRMEGTTTTEAATEEASTIAISTTTMPSTTTTFETTTIPTTEDYLQDVETFVEYF